MMFHGMTLRIAELLLCKLAGALSAERLAATTNDFLTPLASANHSNIGGHTMWL